MPDSINNGTILMVCSVNTGYIRPMYLHLHSTRTDVLYLHYNRALLYQYSINCLL
jgi:hypothetical protein